MDRVTPYSKAIAALVCGVAFAFGIELSAEVEAAITTLAVYLIPNR